MIDMSNELMDVAGAELLSVAANKHTDTNSHTHTHTISLVYLRVHVFLYTLANLGATTTRRPAVRLGFTKYRSIN